MDDDELIASLAGGDDTALRPLFARHAPWLAARLRKALSPDDVEDVLQETFLAVWKNAKNYRPQGTPEAWLWVIARNQAALLLRMLATVLPPSSGRCGCSTGTPAGRPRARRSGAGSATCRRTSATTRRSPDPDDHRGGAAVVIAVTAHGPFGEAERATGRWLPYLRLGAALALTGVAIGLLHLDTAARLRGVRGVRAQPGLAQPVDLAGPAADGPRRLDLRRARLRRRPGSLHGPRRPHPPRRRRLDGP
jgi:hypothetical protein